ncbi:alpha/beta hydrolase [Actinospica sp.]|uniref:alpha/beta fold hydrolase n=1 Tax=Actinospica sp. TaxID=1872142 RepID=UPI002CA1995F|nr:alpha/beta hydrolase [Actinospica sp.]HWG23041.1 alpha/beta hydrolase [Actinospica sp.]
MPRCHANGIKIEYDTFGSPGDPALLLIMGLGIQLTGWEPDLCKQFADRGFHVIRFDNRDAGLSTHFDDAPVPNLGAVLSGDASGVTYLLADMARDAVGLLDALGIRAAHVVGASMGGMIVQELLLHHPDRLLSACSMMSTTGDPGVGHPSPEAAAMVIAPPATTREETIEQGVATWRILQSPAYPMPESVIRDQEAAFYDRCHYPDGGVRQLVAILCSPDRTTGLKAVSTPTLVLHGEADPLINISGGRATAAAIPDSILRTYPGMGHDLPHELWDSFVEEIVANAARAEG